MITKYDVWYGGLVNNGRIESETLQELLADLEGREIEFCIRPRRARTTSKQRRYYHGVVIAMLAQSMVENGVTGTRGGPITQSEVHKMMAQRFLRNSVVDETTGEYIEYVRSTNALTTREMTEYIERIRAWALDMMELTIPDAEALNNTTIITQS